MIIVLEGVDGVGKTSVAHILADQLPLSSLLKLSGAPRDNPEGKLWMQEVYNSLIPFLTELGNKAHIVLDRSWVSELVYSPLFKDYTADYVTAYAIEINGLVDVRYIFLNADLKEIERRVAAKALAQPNETHPDVTTIKRVQEAYEATKEKFNRIFPNKCLSVDTTDLTPKEVASCILGRLLIKPKLEWTYSKTK